MFYALKIIPEGEDCQVDIIAQSAERNDADHAAQSAIQNDPIRTNEYIVSTDPKALMAQTREYK